MINVHGCNVNLGREGGNALCYYFCTLHITTLCPFKKFESSILFNLDYSSAKQFIRIKSKGRGLVKSKLKIYHNSIQEKRRETSQCCLNKVKEEKGKKKYGDSVCINDVMI